MSGLKKVYIGLAIAILLVVLSLVFVCVGIVTPSESFDDIEGFGKIFAASPEFGFESGALVMTCGDYSLNIGIGAPFLSFFSESGVLQVNAFLILLVLLAMVVSCVIPQASLATSGVVALLTGISFFEMIGEMNRQIEAGTSSWDVAAGSFWFTAFLFSVLIINGMIGIGAKILGAIFISDGVRIAVTFLISMLLSNALSIVLCLFAYLTVGIGFCAGILFWFLVALALVVFCEIMDIVGV